MTALAFINSKKLIFWLNFFAIPTETMLAEAPIIVRLPPRQAPSESAHQRILLGIGFDSKINRTIGIIVIVKGILSRKPDTMPETHSTTKTTT